MWHAPSLADAWPELEARFRTATWPVPPEGFLPVAKVRAMRQVLHGQVDGRDVAVKWHRAPRAADRLVRRVRGGRGAREGRLLAHLHARGVAVPEPLAWGDPANDLLVTAWQPDLQPLPAADTWSAPRVGAVAHLVHALDAAGVAHRDLTRANLALQGDRLLLIDLGGARLRRHAGAGRTRLLARAYRGVMMDARRSQMLRALHAFWVAAGVAPDRASRRRQVEALQKEATRARRRFLAGRDRRATRSGRHFQTFRGPNVHRGIRASAHTTDAWEAQLDAWMDAPSQDPVHPGGRTWRVPAPTGDGTLCLKRHTGVLPGRLPRPLRAFRLAEALRTRGVATPAPVIAACRQDGAGVIASHWVEGVDLGRVHRGEGTPAWATWSPAHRRTFLTRLGRQLRRMHDAGVRHRDLKASNLMVVEADTPRSRVVIVDVDGAALRPRGVPEAERARDLARLDASLGASRSERARVLRAYLAVPPRVTTDRGAFVARIEAFVRRKRRRKGGIG